MTESPRGRLECADPAPLLIFERDLPHSIETVWAALTESNRTEHWYGSWTGVPGAGNTIQVTWTAEQDNPTQPMTILSCDPPHLLALASGDEEYPFVITVELQPNESGTRLEFRQPMTGSATPAMLGTGWEFYLDRLTGYLNGDVELPVWDDHYHAIQPHYEELQAAMALCEQD